MDHVKSLCSNGYIICFTVLRDVIVIIIITTIIIIFRSTKTVYKLFQ